MLISTSPYPRSAEALRSGRAYAPRSPLGASARRLFHSFCCPSNPYHHRGRGPFSPPCRRYQCPVGRFRRHLNPSTDLLASEMSLRSASSRCRRYHDRDSRELRYSWMHPSEKEPESSVQLQPLQDLAPLSVRQHICDARQVSQIRAGPNEDISDRNSKLSAIWKSTISRTCATTF